LQLFPAQHALFVLKRHHNRAEAALIALAGFALNHVGKELRDKVAATAA
jgi:hypothetical protein